MTDICAICNQPIPGTFRIEFQNKILHYTCLFDRFYTVANCTECDYWKTPNTCLYKKARFNGPVYQGDPCKDFICVYQTMKGLHEFRTCGFPTFFEHNQTYEENLMLFKPEHVQPILDGIKTDTRRNWLQPKNTREYPGQLSKFSRVKLGRIYKAKTQMLSKDYFAKLKIEKTWREPLKAIDDEGAMREGYPNRAAYLDAYFTINTIPKDEQEHHLNREVWVVSFHVAEIPVKQIVPPPSEPEEVPKLHDPYTKTPIKPLLNKPPLVRMGGKRYLSKLIVPLINKYDYSLYVEPFFGGGRFYFEKVPHFAEIINDKEARLANFFFCCRHWPREMQIQQQFLLKDENSWMEIFDYHQNHYDTICADLQTLRRHWYIAQDPEEKATLQDRMINHAIDFYFLSNMAFRGSLTARTMTYFENDPRTESNRMRWRIYRPLAWVGERMRRTMVLNTDFTDVFKIALKYTNHTRIWVLDPPYWEVEGYEHPFPWEKYEELSNLLQTLPQEDYWLLFLNNHPAIRELFSWCHKEEVETHYTTGGAGQKKEVTELLFTPHHPPKIKPPQTRKLTYFLAQEETPEKLKGD